MSIREFYTELKSKKKNDELKSLYKKPVPEKGEDVPRTQVFSPDVYYQADLLFMPEDKGYRYILVVVDCYDGKLDAEPLKDKSQETLLKAFKAIFRRDILEPPSIITLDSGTEFKGIVNNYLKSLHINVTYAITGRHRQVAIVERANQKIGSILLTRMASQELLTGEVSRQWIDDLKPLIEVLNEFKKKPLKKEISEDPLASKYTGDLIPIGTRVRYLLDYPINTVDNKRLMGKFRSSDIKWSPSIHRVMQVLLKPGYPPMYLIDKDNVARTKQQLNIIKGDEKPPDPKYIRGNPQYYIINKIVDKRKRNGKDEYLINWKGYPNSQNSWISTDEFNRTEDLKQMRREFNART